WLKDSSFTPPVSVTIPAENASWSAPCRPPCSCWPEPQPTAVRTSNAHNNTEIQFFLFKSLDPLGIGNELIFIFPRSAPNPSQPFLPGGFAPPGRRIDRSGNNGRKTGPDDPARHNEAGAGSGATTPEDCTEGRKSSRGIQSLPRGCGLSRRAFPPFQKAETENRFHRDGNLQPSKPDTCPNNKPPVSHSLSGPAPVEKPSPRAPVSTAP